MTNDSDTPDTPETPEPPDEADAENSTTNIIDALAELLSMAGHDQLPTLARLLIIQAVLLGRGAVLPPGETPEGKPFPGEPVNGLILLLTGESQCDLTVAGRFKRQLVDDMLKLATERVLAEIDGNPLGAIPGESTLFSRFRASGEGEDEDETLH